MTVLKKIRDTYAMVGNLKTKHQKELLKYSKDHVINLEGSSSSSFCSSEESSPIKIDTMHGDISQCLRVFHHQRNEHR